MKKQLLGLFILISSVLNAQNYHSKFPQKEMNEATQKALQKHPTQAAGSGQRASQAYATSSGAFSMLKKIEEVKQTVAKNSNSNVNWAQSHDTIFVGVVPHDTLVITGNWHHNGPILIFNDGVLIFYKATVVDTGDIYVFQNGQLLADSSSLTFPQQYFYQRSLIAVQTSTVYVGHSSFNYSGLSHNLVVGGHAVVAMENVHQNDWTTCGLYGKPTLYMNHVNLAGEYILMDSCTAVFKNTDTLLLWHHFPDTANINFAFPNGNAVYGYGFNNTIPTVHGIEYQVGVDSCHDVMWAMMPVNGSDVTISNSTIRAIGNWFQFNDTANVSNLNNNSHYVNFVAPLSDRNQHLINTDVQTWSLYVFDKSHIDVDSCVVGEVGTEQRSTVSQATPFLLDGSGGYYWATDTSSVFSFGATVYSYVRSEKNGVFVFAYGWTPFSAPQAIGQSVMIDVQSNSASDPVALEAATAWFTKIDGPDTSYTNSIFPVMGNSWIDWGPAGTGWMDHKNYSLYFQPVGFPFWGTIVKDSTVELHHANLGNWNTYGLTPGNYMLRLKTKNTLGDSVEALRPVYLKAGVGVAQYASVQNAVRVYPNPSNGSLNVELSDYENTMVEIYNVVGQKVYANNARGELSNIDLSLLANGVYQMRITRNNRLIHAARIVKE
ncbi:MAG: T9SS type A sorting domain-containing protein [Bacteroidia bacterium]